MNLMPRISNAIGQTSPVKCIVVDQCNSFLCTRNLISMFGKLSIIMGEVLLIIYLDNLRLPNLKLPIGTE